MLLVVLVQVCAALTVAALAAFLAGAPAAVSAALGGLACALPNGAFALHLVVLDRLQPPGSRPALRRMVLLLAGEFCKVFLTVALLALLAWLYKAVVWRALIVSVGAVLLVQPVVLAWRPSMRPAGKENQ